MLIERCLAYMLKNLYSYICTMKATKCKLNDKPIKRFAEKFGFWQIHIKVIMYILQILGVKLLKWVLNWQHLKKRASQLSFLLVLLLPIHCSWLLHSFFSVLSLLRCVVLELGLEARNLPSGFPTK